MKKSIIAVKQNWQNHIWKLLFLGIFFCSAGCIAQGQPAAAAPGNGFKLQDTLGRTWRNEIVTFALSATDLQNVKEGRALVEPDGKQVAYQLIKGTDGAEQIAFDADLDAFETRVYHFTTAKARPSTDLKIEKTSDGIRLTNSKTGILLRAKLAAGQGPIAGVRLQSGTWVGDSAVQKTPTFASYSATVTAKGPVFAEVLCTAKTSDGHSWVSRYRLPANAPVVLVDETFNLQYDAAYTVDFSPNFAPDHLLYRQGRSSAVGRLGTLMDWKIGSDANPAYVLEPWVHWWMRDRQGNWFGLYNSSSNDLLSVGAYAADVWVDPSARPRPAYQVDLQKTKQGLSMTLPLAGGRREWMISALDKAPSLALLQGKNTQVSPPPQQYLIKYGTFPLNRVKDEMTFAQMTQSADHPRLFVTKTQVSQTRKTFKADPATLAKYRTATLSGNSSEGPISYFLGTGDAALGKHIADVAITNMQGAVNMYLGQDGIVEALGVAPQNQSRLFAAINLTDAVLDTPYISPEMRTRLQGQLAFLGYTVNRPDYWSPARGFSANPNMTSTVAAYQVALGAMLPMHPLSKTWMQKGLSELKRELYDWSDDKGGWIEAPGYALVSYDYMVGGFLMAKNAGLPDYSYDPRMKAVATWLAEISTPPDAGVLGWRHLPPIGNTYLNEITGEFGLVAGVWKDKDPAFASQMQWMYAQQGSNPTIAVGGFFPTMAGYRTSMIDNSIPEKAPAYGSVLFPKTGVVLHNHFPSDRETYLHIIAGNNHAHYDHDSGSIVVWGKGQRIADDFGYEGNMPGADHNMLVSPAAPDGAIMHVDKFAPSPAMDYVRAQKEKWTRQIIFVKSDDPLAGNYFVINDSMSIPAPATWRLWLASNDVKINKQGATAVGEQDVDTDIFFARPAAPSLKTEVKTRKSYGIDSKGKYHKLAWTQTGLIADADGQNGNSNFTTVLYPRLKSQKPPIFTSLSGGKVTKVQNGDDTDYIFLNRTPFKFDADGISFEGTSGLARLRDGKATLTLGDGGTLSALGKTIQKKVNGRL